jgi:hypothetical protein
MAIELPSRSDLREIAERRMARYGSLAGRLAVRPARGLQGSRFARRLAVAPGAAAANADAPNPLEAYFDANVEGPGIWKWRHYFDIYHRHFAKFVGRPVNIVEIGVYSGGSLGMWRHYFGDQARVYGVDIEPACHAYESDSVRIFTGDQADPAFWARFRDAVPEVDIVIDDGGHESRQQIATLEALLGHMRPGGVFVCEDLVGSHNAFAHYARGLSRELNAAGPTPNELQRSIECVSFYPYSTVIERRATPLDALLSQKRGTEWQPFFDASGVNVT